MDKPSNADSAGETAALPDPALAEQATAEHPRGGGSPKGIFSDTENRSGGQDNFFQWVSVEAWAFSVGLTDRVVREAAGRLPRGMTRKTRGAGVLQLSPAGQAQLWQEFGLGEVAAENAPAAENEGGPVRVRVEGLPLNTHLLLARLGDLAVRVRVRDNRVFIRGQEVLARKSVGGPEDMYELAQRHPRRRGERV